MSAAAAATSLATMSDDRPGDALAKVLCRLQAMDDARPDTKTELVSIGDTKGPAPGKMPPPRKAEKPRPARITMAQCEWLVKRHATRDQYELTMPQTLVDLIDRKATRDELGETVRRVHKEMTNSADAPRLTRLFTEYAETPNKSTVPLNKGRSIFVPKRPQRTKESKVNAILAKIGAPESSLLVGSTPIPRPAPAPLNQSEIERRLRCNNERSLIPSGMSCAPEWLTKLEQEERLANPHVSVDDVDEADLVAAFTRLQVTHRFRCVVCHYRVQCVVDEENRCESGDCQLGGLRRGVCVRCLDPVLLPSDANVRLRFKKISAVCLTCRKIRHDRQPLGCGCQCPTQANGVTRRCYWCLPQFFFANVRAFYRNVRCDRWITEIDGWMKVLAAELVGHVDFKANSNGNAVMVWHRIPSLVLWYLFGIYYMF